MTKDRDYLIYDLDRSEVISILESIPDAAVIATNPCFELWYLRHYNEQKSAIISEN